MNRSFPCCPSANVSDPVPAAPDGSSESSSEEPSPVVVLEALWKAVRDHYPMLEYVGSRDEEWLAETRAKVTAAPNRQAAFDAMDELVCRLNDYHTRFFAPNAPRVESPPVKVAVVARKRGRELNPFSWSPDPRIHKPSLPSPFHPFEEPPNEMPPINSLAAAVVDAPDDSGLRAGDEIISVDGTPVREALAVAWRHSVGSTLEAKLNAAAWRMLRGDPDQPAEIEILRGRGASRIVRTPRSGFPPEPVIVVREIDRIPLVRIRAWGNDGGLDLIAEFDRILKRYRKSPGLIFDVRGNGGGSDEMADRVTGRFLDHPVISSISFHRQAPSLSFERTVERAQPRGPWRYEGRVALLIDDGCKSACEHFVSGMAEAGALLAGTPTDGACGWIHAVDLPGGARLNVSRTFPLHTGGLPSPLLGIAPHLHRLKSLPDLRSGRDAALDAAIKWVRPDEGKAAR